ncbi:MAG: VanW family protein [Clostridiaceae bacterium]|nr:VanW family protein [Eubacteriales bacterium]
MREPARSERQKGRPVWVAVVNAVVVISVALATMFLGVYGGIGGVVKRSVFAQGTSVDGIELSGMSKEAGSGLVLASERERLDAIRITVSFNGAAREFSASELGVSGNADEVLNVAYTYNKSGDLLADFDSTQDALKLNSNISVDKEMLVETVGAFLNENARDMMNASVTFDPAARSFAYTPERCGVAAHTEAICAALEGRILSGDYGPFDVSGEYAEDIEPEVTMAELQANTALIVQFRTLATDNKNRNKNIELMCEAVNGAVIGPGETLSLNGIVGQRTAEKGFTVAPAIVDGQLTDDVGGGICQLAGTLYNAALLADMEIVERVHHTWPSDYLPIGLDATLNWNNKDLKIKNRSAYPIYVVAELKDLVVSVELYGQPLGEDEEIVVENRIVNQTETPAPQVIYTDKLAVGASKTQVKSRPGYEVLVYRHYLKGGAVYRSELISHDHFRSVQGTVMIGTSEVIK